MGVFSRRLERRSTLSNPPEWLLKWFGGGKTSSGASVSNYSAMNYSAWWACVRVISKPVATMPLHLLERLDGGGKRRATDYPTYNLLNSQPNSEMTALAFKDALTAHVISWGNGYAEIEFNRFGDPVALWPLTPNRVTPERNKVTGALEYKVNLYGIDDLQGVITLQPYQVFHLVGPGFDGVKGYSVMTMFRESIGLGLSLQEYSSRFFGNGAMPAGILKHPGTLEPDSRSNIRESWNDMHQGLSRAHRVAILEEGMEYVKLGVSPEDAQALESRKFSQLEMASILQIPPHKIGHLSDATYSNIEQENQSFLSDTLLYWLTLWEQTSDWKLLPSKDRTRYFHEFLTASMLRGDLQSRYAAYSVGRQWGWLSADDVRSMENMNPLPNGQGEIYMVPLNMIPADQMGQEPPPSSFGSPEDVARSVAERRFLEFRADSIAKGRRNLAKSFKPVFLDTGARLINREINDLKRALKEHMGKRDSAGFLKFVEDYYNNHSEFVSRQFSPVFLAYAEAVQGSVSEEIGSEAGMTSDLEQFIRAKYVSDFSAKYSSLSRGRIEKVFRNAEESGEDPVPVFEQKLEEWREKVPEKISTREVVKAAGAVSLFLYKAHGFIKKRWHAQGQSCPYCQKLNGKIVGIEYDFVGGVGVDDGSGQKLTPKGKIGHAPLHYGCDCVVLAER